MYVDVYTRVLPCNNHGYVDGMAPGKILVLYKQGGHSPLRS